LAAKPNPVGLPNPGAVFSGFAVSPGSAATIPPRKRHCCRPARPLARLEEETRCSCQHFLQVAGARVYMSSREVHDLSNRGRHADLLPRFVHRQSRVSDPWSGGDHEDFMSTLGIEMMLEGHRHAPVVVSAAIRHD